MDSYTEIRLHKFLRTALFRRIAKVLIFLMMIQTWPLWEISRSYEFNLEIIHHTLNHFIEYLSPCEAQAGTLFGPKKYIRTTGKPNVYRDSFLANPGKGWLIILNGEENGERRISSAIIVRAT